MGIKVEISLELVKKLIHEQFPQWAHLSIKQVVPGGHDNRTFRLGKEMSIRLPSDACYAPKVKIEHKWLPFLSANLSVQIPKPIAMGAPTSYYPWHWSIYNWINGESANNLLNDDLDLKLLAKELAIFLKELHIIDITDAPEAGPHNFYRGGDLAVYDTETKAALKDLHSIIDTSAAIKIWDRALNSKWLNKPVWIHGDLSAGNILIKNKKLTAVIDFGGMGIGDPACDLAIAWTFFDYESRQIFKSILNLDPETWDRARGWVLWKALITLAALKDKNSSEAIKQKLIINDLINEYAYL